MGGSGSILKSMKSLATTEDAVDTEVQSCSRTGLLRVLRGLRGGELG
jgi:hypothetical protein